MLIALDIPPGMYRSGTEYQAQGRYYDGNLVRFHENTIRPVGGWEVRTEDAVSGKARALLSWSTNSTAAWTAIGSHTGLYVVSRTGALTDITPSPFYAGNADARQVGGYGEGLYGVGTYGTPRPSTSSVIPASIWSLDTFGEYLVGTRGGTIYEWTLSTSSPAQPIANAPEAEAILVTDERILMALGSGGDPKAVDWSDAEDNTDWTPSSTNFAGGKRLSTDGNIRMGLKVRGGYLILTDVDAHLATYDRLPLVYRFDRISDDAGVVSKGAGCSVNGDAYWMGQNGFWTYRGVVEPLPCDVSDYVFTDINRLQISKVTCWHNSLWKEVWWHYPSAGSDEVDRYVVHKYSENHWSFGELDRFVGSDQGVVSGTGGAKVAQMIGSDGLLYAHEIGFDHDGVAPFLISGPVEIGNGDRVMEVEAIVPDETNLGDVAVSFYGADYPMSAETLVAATTARAMTPVRFSGRRVSVRMVADADQDFRVGRFRFGVKPGARR